MLIQHYELLCSHYNAASASDGYWALGYGAEGSEFKSQHCPAEIVKPKLTMDKSISQIFKNENIESCEKLNKLKHKPLLKEPVARYWLT